MAALRIVHVGVCLGLMCAWSPGFAAETSPYAEIIAADQPVVWWRCEAAKADVAKVTAPSSIDIAGRMVGTVKTGAEGPRPPYFPAFAEDNKALEFKGDGASLRFTDPGDNSPLDFQNGDAITMEAWVNVTKLGNGQQMYVFGKGRTKNKDVAAENQNYALRVSGEDGQACISFLFRDVDNRPGKQEDFHRWTATEGFGIDSGWHHIAVTYVFGDPDTIRGYSDGKPVKGKWDYGGATKEAPVVDNDELWIGSSMGGNPSSTFQGQIDEVALYRTALSPERIALRYVAVAPPSYETPEELVTANDVLVEIIQGFADKYSWNFPVPTPSESFRWPHFAMTELPQKYTNHGVRGDWTNPTMLRLSSRMTFPAGEISLRLRSRSGSRLWIDGELITENKFPTRGGDGHNELYPEPNHDADALHGLQPGDYENVGRYRSTGKPCRVQVDVYVGGKKRRLELGELVLAWSPVESDSSQMVIASPQGEGVRFSNLVWESFAPSLSMHEMNRRRRHEASREWTEYWDRRHAQAQTDLAALPPLAVPANPAGYPQHNPIDAFLNTKLAEKKTEPVALTDDVAFLRRMSLDIVGTIPTPELRTAYFAQPVETRRSWLNERLLNDNGWADHWVSYWQDVLAENPNLINPTLNNTGPFRWWLHEAFEDNRPFDRFATELILMEGSTHYGGPAGFGIASQNDSPMAAKAHVLAQAFLGMEMKCARCHDAPYHPFTQKDLFSFAAMLNRDTIKLPKTSTIPGDPAALQSLLVKVTLKPGEAIPPDWPFAEELSGQFAVDMLLNPKDRREQLAALVTSPHNRRFGQVIVNRMWQRYMGRGIVEPADDWEHGEPIHTELLTWLEREMIRSGYDLKHVARLIFQSHAYQRQPDGEALTGRTRAELFAGPTPRRMTAEQVVDSLFVATGKPWHVEQLNIDVDSTRTFEQSLNFGVPNRAWQFLSMSNERDRPSLSLPTAQPVIDVLEAFGWRGSRPDPLTVRPTETTVLQPAILANGVLAQRMSQLSDDSRFTEYAIDAPSVDEFITRVTQTILTRDPTPAERQTFAATLTEGFAERRQASIAKAASRPPRHTGVGWSNHLKPEASDRKIAMKTAVDRGDPPSLRLEPDWRQRAEDMVWALINESDFLFVP
ncbi:MAG TPA: DUF1553 domain-containing protein [Planctomycetaceae bacterium]|nr:DUF1553 domain-containing protein [Planctomycetaceae bacterium]